MLPRLLALPLILLAGFIIYSAWYVDTSYGIYLLPVVLTLVALYIFEPQIDWWWYSRNPPDIDGPLQKLFAAKMPYYRQLDKKQKTRFRRRCAMYMMANEFIPKGPETVPEDLKAMVAANVVQLTFGQNDYRLNRFERIVVYPTSFPSPQYPEHFHASEIFEEDGVLLFAADHLLPGTLEPHRYLNLGLYEYAKIFRLCYPDYAYPAIGNDQWPVLEQISGFAKAKILQYLGLPDIDLNALAITLFFSFPEKFKAHLPEAAQQLQLIFNQDPSQMSNPILNMGKIDLEKI